MRGKNEILVVDDIRMNRVTFTDILKDKFDILEAENGEIALQKLAERKETIALIITDLMMPVMDGFEFLEEIRKVDSYRNIPVIVATTSDDMANECRCLELGAWDFIPKTFHPEIIRFRVLNAIDKSKVRVLEYDSLTGIYNQQKFYQITREFLDTAGDANCAFVQFDIERFTMINSFYGSGEGNRLICYLADAIKETLDGASARYTYGRIGGDVFGACLSYDTKESLMELVEAVKTKVKCHSVHYYLEVSSGIYLIEDKDMDVAVIHDKASMAADRCKGQYMMHNAFYTKEMDTWLLREQRIINEMDTALAEEQFVVYFQPKYELERLTPYGAEALVRWQRPDGTLVPPGEFIPIFEKNGFIIKSDFYVWEKVCQFIRRELDGGRCPAPISVNVSRVNLYNPKFLETLINLVEKYKIPPKHLNLELTESAFSDNTDMIQDAVDYLHRVGFTIMMDDFGSGYSSLNILKDINLDVLKIDMKFLSKSKMADSRGTKILEAVVRMAQSLKMPVIAEGVEEREQVDFLCSLGCDYIQGYYFAEPMSIDRYKKLIGSPD